MQFSLGALRQAAEALDHLRQRVRHWAQVPQGEADADAAARTVDGAVSPARSPTI